MLYKIDPSVHKMRVSCPRKTPLVWIRRSFQWVKRDRRGKEIKAANPTQQPPTNKQQLQLPSFKHVGGFKRVTTLKRTKKEKKKGVMNKKWFPFQSSPWIYQQRSMVAQRRRM